MTDHPMRPVEFLLLAVLADEPRHGYGIVQEIESRTDGEVSIPPGNLYRVLDRLLDRDLVHEADRPADDDDRRRRYYRITGAGRRVLATEARILGGIADEVRGRREAPGTSS